MALITGTSRRMLSVDSRAQLILKSQLDRENPDIQDLVVHCRLHDHSSSTSAKMAISVSALDLDDRRPFKSSTIILQLQKDHFEQVGMTNFIHKPRSTSLALLILSILA